MGKEIDMFIIMLHTLIIEFYSKSRTQQHRNEYIKIIKIYGICNQFAYANTIYYFIQDVFNTQ